MKLTGILSLTLAVAAVLFVGTAGSLSAQTPSDTCGEILTGDGSTSGQWAEGCQSEVPGRGYARYYSFSLDSQSEVTITLESSEADTYLYLREGEAWSGDFLHQNDDHDGITKSQVQATLAAGTYTIEATTYSEGEVGSFTLTVAGLGATATTPGPDRVALIALYNATDMKEAYPGAIYHHRGSSYRAEEWRRNPRTKDPFIRVTPITRTRDRTKPILRHILTIDPHQENIIRHHHTAHDLGSITECRVSINESVEGLATAEFYRCHWLIVVVLGHLPGQ